MSNVSPPIEASTYWRTCRLTQGDDQLIVIPSTAVDCIPGHATWKAVLLARVIRKGRLSDSSLGPIIILVRMQCNSPSRWTTTHLEDLQWGKRFIFWGYVAKLFSAISRAKRNEFATNFTALVKIHRGAKELSWFEDTRRGISPRNWWKDGTRHTLIQNVGRKESYISYQSHRVYGMTERYWNVVKYYLMIMFWGDYYVLFSRW